MLGGILRTSKASVFDDYLTFVPISYIAVSYVPILVIVYFSALSPSMIWLTMMRFLVGFGVGGIPQVVTYFVEFMPIKTQYNPVALAVTFGIVGQIVTLCLAMWINPLFGFQWWLFSGAVPVIFSCIYCIWMPESPEFDVENGNNARAVKTLQYVAQLNNSTLPRGRLVSKSSTPNHPTLAELFSDDYFLITIVGSILHFSVLFCFYGVIIFLPEVLSRFETSPELSHTGETSHPNITDQSCSAVVTLKKCHPIATITYEHSIFAVFGVIPASLILSVFINQMNRQLTLALSFLICAICCGLLIIAPVGIMATILLQICEITINLQHIFIYVYTAELYPTHIRALGSGISDAVGRCGALATPIVAQWLMVYSINAALTVYLVLGMLSAVLCWFFRPKEKSEELVWLQPRNSISGGAACVPYDSFS